MQQRASFERAIVRCAGLDGVTRGDPFDRWVRPDGVLDEARLRSQEEDFA